MSEFDLDNISKYKKASIRKILLQLKNETKYGAQIKHDLKKGMSGGALPDGTLYPTLAFLKKHRLLKSEKVSSVLPNKGYAVRTFYTITEEGISVLQKLDNTIDA